MLNQDVGMFILQGEALLQDTKILITRYVSEMDANEYVGQGWNVVYRCDYYVHGYSTGCFIASREV